MFKNRNLKIKYLVFLVYFNIGFANNWNQFFYSHFAQRRIFIGTPHLFINHAHYHPLLKDVHDDNPLSYFSCLAHDSRTKWLHFLDVPCSRFIVLVIVSIFRWELFWVSLVFGHLISLVLLRQAIHVLIFFPCRLQALPVHCLFFWFMVTSVIVCTLPVLLCTWIHFCLLI